ncbi:hypothetical protein [Magnetospira thiophila]
MSTTLLDIEAGIVSPDSEWDVIDGVIQGGWRSGYLDLSGLNLLDIRLIDGGAGNDTIFGTALADTIRGGTGNDILSGGGGNDVFLVSGTNQGNDRIEGGAGDDTILGGSGNDVIGVDQDLDVSDSIEVIDGGAGINSIRGSWRHNQMDFSQTELRQIDLIDGGSGNDTITGSAGADTIQGGAGEDILSGGDGDDLFLVTGSGQDFDRFDGGAGMDTILGGSGDDVIGISDDFSATHAVEVIDGGAGFDTIQGSWRSNYMDFSATELRQIDLIDGGDGQDILIGSAAADTIRGGAGDDVLYGGDGDDVFLSSGLDQGWDQLDGGSGDDQLIGGSGDDLFGLQGDFGAANSIEAIHGGDGLDVIQGSWRSDQLDFSATDLFGIERIDGGDGHDTITGSAEADIIDGGAGNDWLVSNGLGGDTFFGGDGIDTVAFSGRMADYVLNGTARTVTYANGVSETIGDDVEFLNFADVQLATTDMPIADNGPSITPPFALSGIVLQVGVGQTYATVQEAWAAAQSGDTILVHEGTYSFSGNEYYSRYDPDHPLLIEQDLVIMGVGDVVFDVGQVTKGALVTQGAANLYVENITFANANNTYLNGAGIRHQGSNLTVVNSTFENNQNGILGGGDGQTVHIVGSEFIGNGAGDGFSHAIYISGGDSLVVEDSSFRDTSIGHHVKSLCAETVVRNSILDDGAGTASMNIDVTAGGDLLVEGNTLIQSPASDNPHMIWYSTSRGGTAGSITIRDNVIINNMDGGTVIGVAATDLGLPMVLENNTITDPVGTISISNNPYTSSGNLMNGEAMVDGLYDPAVNWGNYASNTLDLSTTDPSVVRMLDGGDGNDTLIGSESADLLIGGGGNDTLYGNGGDDLFRVQGAGQGFDQYFGGVGFDTVLGGAGDDVIGLTGTFGPGNGIEVIDGGAGQDVILGSWHSNTFDFSATELRGIEWIDGADGSDTIIGTQQADTILGNAGDDTLFGNGGDDLFLVSGVNQGFDVVNGGAGMDTVQGGAGNDVIGIKYDFNASQSVEVIDGGAGIDIIQGSWRSNTLDFSGTELRGIEAIDGGDGNDTIIGSNSDDTVLGGNGNDTYVYDASNPTSGQDHFDGGAGTGDTVQVEFDNLVDYAAGYQDLMALLDSISGGKAPADNAPTPQFVGLTVENVENLTVVVAGFDDPVISYSTAQPDNAVVSAPADLGN